MLSRYAEALYWVGRYVERAENTARFLDVATNLSIDEAARPDAPWRMVLSATGEANHFDQLQATMAPRAVLRFFCRDTRNENSILSCLQKARENARSLRPILSSEMWEQINRAYLGVHSATLSDTFLDVPNDLLSSVKRDAHLFWGLHDGTMTHGEGWHFARLGSLMERADQISRVLSGYLGSMASDTSFDRDHEPRLAALLKSVSAFEMYRKRHGQIRDDSVGRFLLFDGDFPRSVRFCLAMAVSSLRGIVAAPLGAEPLACERGLGRLLARFEYAELEQFQSEHLPVQLEALREELVVVHRALEVAFFHS